MKRLAVLSVFATLALAACGSNTHLTANQSTAAKQDTAKAEAVLKMCLKDPASLRSHSGRVTFENCAVPANKRKAFDRCLVSGVLSGIPTKGRIENTVQVCIGRAA